MLDGLWQGSRDQMSSLTGHRAFPSIRRMSTESENEAVESKDDAISCVSTAESDEASERLLQAPLIPHSVHLIIIALALIFAFQTKSLGGILIGIPIWLLFDEILESRSKARMRAFYDSIKARDSKSPRAGR